MSDEAKALVEALRTPGIGAMWGPPPFEAAADLIETQAREIERLREALGKNAARFERCADMISDGGNPSGILRVERFLQAKQYAIEARAALEGGGNATSK